MEINIQQFKVVSSLWWGQGLLQELFDLVNVSFHIFVVDEERRLRTWSHVPQQFSCPETVHMTNYTQLKLPMQFIYILMENTVVHETFQTRPQVRVSCHNKVSPPHVHRGESELGSF